MKIKKGDIVTINRGKDAGKTGKVLRMLNKKNKVIVEGINKYKRHVKRQSEEQPGGIVEVEKGIHISNVAKKAVVAAKPAKKKTTTKKSVKKTSTKKVK